MPSLRVLDNKDENGVEIEYTDVQYILNIFNRMMKK